MLRSPLEYLRHILDEAAYILKVCNGLEKFHLIENETLKRAIEIQIMFCRKMKVVQASCLLYFQNIYLKTYIVRSIEIIGEATKKVPEDFRSKYPQIEWRAMAGMRDKLIYDYFGIDYDIVWDVVINKIPALKNHLEQIMHQETEGE